MASDDTTQLTALRERVKAAYRAALDLAPRAGTDQQAADSLEFALTQIEAGDRRTPILDAMLDAKVVREPDIYQRGGEHSFLRDLAADVAPMALPGANPLHARERLERHANFEVTLREADGRGAERRAAALGIQTGRPDGAPTQSRALSSIVPGSGGVFVPPRWMTEDFASVVRAVCPLRQLVRTIPLPPDTLELHIPRINVSGGVLAETSGDNVNPPGTASATDAIVAEVATFTGELPVSQQLWARGNFDAIAVPDMAENYAAALQSQLVNGTGTGGQMLGLLNVSTAAISANEPGATVNALTAASPTTDAVVQAVGQLAANVADARERPPSVCLMRPSRWYWLTFNPPAANQATGQLIGTGVVPDDPDVGPYGPLPGSLPVYLDSTIPTNLGAGANQDAAIVVRARDIILLEEPEPHFQALVDTAGGAAELTVVLVFHTYAAAFTSRYPSAIGSVTGTGFVVPSGW
jgi:HK97 family phage major capsid protein